MGVPFVTTTELTDKLGTSAATARGTAVVTAACDIVRTFTEQHIYPVVAGGTFTLDGTGTDSLLLPQRPTSAAGTVLEGSGTLTAGSDYVLSDNAVLHRKPGVIDSGWGVEQLRTYWWPGRQNIEVTCDYGYDSTTIPTDLKEVALSIAARLMSAGSGNVVFEQLGQRSIRYDGAASDLTSTERIILRKYKVAK